MARQGGTPTLFYFFILLSLAFIASQLLMSLLLYTGDAIQEMDLDIFGRLAPQIQRVAPLESCDAGKCDTDTTSETIPTEPYNEVDGHCKQGHFHLDGSAVCHPLLTCKDFDDVIVAEKIGGGAVKQVYLAKWKSHTVVMSNLTHPDLRDDFLHGAEMLQAFQESDFVVQLLGYCETPIPALITEYHNLGSLDKIDQILQEKDTDNIVTRFALCLNYVRIIHYLHTGPIGTRVMCDSNDLHKTLSQFLVTSDLKIVINDLDALPLVDSSTGLRITCGHRELVGDFVALEQLWPYHPEREFSEESMPGYDEMTDIWKIPSVVDYLLGSGPLGDVVRFNLFKVHSLCRSKDPADRPSASQVLDVYLEVKQSLQL